MHTVQFVSLFVNYCVDQEKTKDAALLSAIRSD